MKKLILGLIVLSLGTACFAGGAAPKIIHKAAIEPQYELFLDEILPPPPEQIVVLAVPKRIMGFGIGFVEQTPTLSYSLKDFVVDAGINKQGANTQALVRSSWYFDKNFKADLLAHINSDIKFNVGLGYEKLIDTLALNCSVYFGENLGQVILGARLGN